MKNHQGFTLVEVLIALVLLSFIMLAAGSLTTNGIDSKEQVLESDERVLAIELAFRKIDSDLALIYNPLKFSNRLNIQNALKEIKDDYQRQIVEERLASLPETFNDWNENWLPIPRFYYQDKSIIEFMTVGHRRKYQDEKSTKFTWVSYEFIKGEENTFSLVRYSQAQYPFSGDRLDPEEVKSIVLIRDIIKYKFLFWHDDKKKFVEEFDEEDPFLYPIRGIKLELTYQDHLQREQYIERIFRPTWPWEIIESPKEIEQLQSQLKPIKKDS